MGYYAYDVNGYLGDLASNGGWAAFVRWAERQSGPVRAFVEEGATKDPAALAAALTDGPAPPSDVEEVWVGLKDYTRALVLPSRSLAMLKSARLLLAAAATVSAVGCARTSMTSMPAPEIRGRSFHNILVVAEIGDLALKIEMEGRVAAGLVSAFTRPLPGVTFVPSHSVLFPGREYTGEQVVELMRQHQVDAILVVTPGATGSTEGWVPPTYSTTCTRFSITTGCTTTQSGGFSYSRQWAQFSAKLFDAANGQVVWVATATSGGNAFARTSDLVRSMADKTLTKLHSDQVIQADCAGLWASTPDPTLGPRLTRRIRVIQDSLARLREAPASLTEETPIPAGATVSQRAYVDTLNAALRRERAMLGATQARLTRELQEAQSAQTQNNDLLAARTTFCPTPPRP